MHLDALEFLAEQGAAPIENLYRGATGCGRTEPVSIQQGAASLTSVEWSALTSHYLGAPLESGHDVARFQNGSEIFPAMLASIRMATHSIELLSFIFSDGEIADRFCEALIERARAGVRVRILLDALGSKAMSNQLIARMQDSEMELLIYHPISSWKFWRTTSRNHRKILVVDSRVAYTGGVGIADQWAGDGNHAGSVRDTQFRITGPGVGLLKGAFFSNWASAGGRLPDPLDPTPTTSAPQDGIKAAVVPSSTASKYSRAALMFQLLTRCAEHSLQIVTPYFVPGSPLLGELEHAAKRGVDVRIMVSGKHNDHWLPLFAGRACYQQLLDAGALIEEYDLTLMHSKLVIADEKMLMFGSPNINERSQSLDEELAVLCHDRKLAAQLLADVQADRAHCRKIEGSQWAQRPFMHRAAEALAGAFSAQI